MDISLKDEIWKEVVNYPQYLISNKGRVYSKRSKKILKEGYGDYLSFVVSVDNKQKTMNIHREVAKAFLGPYPDGMQVAHLDGNRYNNNVENLQYVTPKINQSHRIIHGTSSSGAKNGRAIISKEIAQETRERYLPYKITAPYLARQYGISETQAYRIIKGEQWI